MDAGMIIAGAGECGTQAALALRGEGYAEPITLIGAEIHPPYERPPLSKQAMAAGGGAARLIAEKEKFREAGIDLLLGAEVTSIDRIARSVRFGERTLGYDKLLLATGARPRRLAMAEGNRHCLYLRTHDDAGRIASRLREGARVTVIGGGFIGLELAAAARARGCTVALVETQQRVLMRGVPAAIADVVANAHRDQGVRLRCGIAIDRLAETGDGVVTQLADGEEIAADLCIIGIGAVPNTDLAEQAGLEIDNGIRVDSHLRTSDPHIFAAGDCCSFPLSIYDGRRVRLEAWRNAQEQGALAARNMLGRSEPHAYVPWFWSDQFDLSLQIAGLVDEGAETVRRDLGQGAFVIFHLNREGRLMAASGIGLGNSVARDIRLAELMIERRIYPPRDKLGAPDTKLKSLLAA